MPLKLKRRGKVWWISGTVRGVAPDGRTASVSVYKSAATYDRTVAEAIRAKTESRILDEIAYGKAKVISFREAAESYLESGGSGRFVLDIHKDGSESGIMVHFGETRLTDIRQNDLDDAARKLYPTATPETRNRQCYTPFIAVWNHAVKNGWADVRLWSRPKKPKGTNVVRLGSGRSGTAPVDYARAARFVAAMSPAPAMLMTFLFYTGLRPIEAFALQADDVRMADRWLVVRSSKTGEPRGVPVHRFLASWLPDLVVRGASSEDGVLFRTPRGRPYGAVQEGGGGLKSAIAGARRRTGIDDVSPYTGRHTVSTGLVIAGVHPHIKDQILGHVADSMSRHYTNVPQRPLIDAIDLLPSGDFERLPWVESPRDWWGKLAEGTGKRVDLEGRRKA